MTGGQPHLLIVAGPNGAGKSSWAPTLLRDTLGLLTYVNADVIAQGLSGFRPEDAAMQAGRVMLERMAQLAARRESFAIETTLSGQTLRRHCEALRASGYVIHIVYLWLASAELAIARVRQRVIAGGHDVAEVVVRRRWAKSFPAFLSIYRPLAATWRVYDASGPGEPALVAHGGGPREESVVAPAAWRTMLGPLSPDGAR